MKKSRSFELITTTYLINAFTKEEKKAFINKKRFK